MNAWKRLAGLGAVVAAAVGGAGIAQMPTNPPPPPTEAEIAASPAAKRLAEILAIASNGGIAATRDYVQANFAPDGTVDGAPPLEGILRLHHLSRGLKLERFARVTGTEVLARVQNALTEAPEGLVVQTEAEAPHRIKSVMPTGARQIPPAGPFKEEAALRNVDAFVKRLSDAGVFSGVVLIAREGKPIYQKSYGFADRAHSIPNDLNTRFRLASINKMMTGLAIGQLVERGRLSYEDPLSKFIPDFPDAESAKKIKIKHLLSHTSGLGDYFSPAYFSAINDMRDIPSLMRVSGREPPEFEPGTSWRYSNIGFLLLGRIIEVASGEDYYAYMDKHIFGPAGMKSSGFPHLDRGVKNLAHPYELQLKNDRFEGADISAEVVKRGSPAGDGIATAPDLLRLANAMRAGRLVKPETLRLHASPKPELGSATYGYGFETSSRVPNRDIAGHLGDFGGSCTEFGMIRDMPSPYTVVILANSSFTSCHSVTRKIYNSLAPAAKRG